MSQGLPSGHPHPRLSNRRSLGAGLLLPTGCERALDTLPREQQGGDLPGDCLCEPASTQPVAFKDRPLPAPSASGTSCLMEQELAPGKTINFNASGHSSQTEPRHPDTARRGLEITWPTPSLHLSSGWLGDLSMVPQLVHRSESQD